ncbi:right-handed parallel beta-helix repeat-containing protein [Roseimaritima multifibrata]|nr:right-handed parallel beta-helix repeat-containing protein [Roseimaritima multifibrata]
MRPTISRLLCSLVATLLFSSAALAEKKLTVSSASAKSLTNSLAELRDLREAGDTSPIKIVLPAGTYQLETPLRLDDSIVGEGLTLQAESPHKTILSGAVNLKGTASETGSSWRYDLPIDYKGLPPRVILVNGTLQTAARHPNVGYSRIVASVPDRRSGFQFTPADLPADVSPETGVCDLVFLHDWSSSRLPIRSINHQTDVLETLGPIGCSAPHYAIDHFEKQPRYWLEGHRSFADLPGEWYIDREKNQLILLGDTTKPAPSVQLPVTEQLIVAQATGDNTIKNLLLQGLVFTGTPFPMPAGGLSGAQATMHEPRSADGSRSTPHRPMLSAAVQIDQGQNCRVENCRFNGIGNTALWLGSRSNHCVIAHSKFSDIGGNAINLGEDNARHVKGKPWYRSAPQQVPVGNQVTDCEIRNCGQVLFGSVAIWAALHEKLQIAQNLIEDCPYTGISLGWIWNDSPSPAKDNQIHHNQIRRVMQVLSDGGGIYTLGNQPNSRLESNTISDVPLNAGRAESNGMFLDEGSTGFTITDNQFRRIAKSPLRFHKAGNNQAVANRWELETDRTPNVRYNATPQENITLRDNQVLAHQPRTYLIGNSLTWDTRPSNLDHYVNWHVDCGKSLQFIHDRPAAPCVGSSRLWPTALTQLHYNYLVVQPHYGTTLEQDQQVIEQWMDMQPRAIVVIHTGWAFSEKATAEFASKDHEKMIHNAAYFEALIESLKTRHPEREFRQTYATQALHQIATDIKAGEAPIENLSDLYRDAIHMTIGEGRYLMHNLMRRAVDQPTTSAGFKIADQNPELKAYLDGVIRDVVPAKQ